MSGFFSRAAVVALVLGAARLLRADEASPLSPGDTRAFLEETRQNLRSDRLLLDQYTFNETFTEKRLDGKGAVKKAKTEVYEVYPSLEPGKMYRRLIARDGQPLSEKELAEQDRKQEEKTEKRERRREQEDDAARQKRLAKEEANRQKEREVVDEIFRMDAVEIAGREVVDGRPAVIVRFTPKPGFRPATDAGKIIQKVEGRAWIDEQDKQLVRLETTLLDTLGVGPAGVARLQKGSTGYFQRRKVNDEIWLPSEARFTGQAKVLLLFGTRVDVLSQYGQYKKFSVGTEEEVSTEKATN